MDIIFMMLVFVSLNNVYAAPVLSTLHMSHREPVTTQNSVTIETSVTTQNSVTIENSVTTQNSVTVENSVTTQNSVTTENPGRSENSVTSQNSVTTDKSGRTENSVTTFGRTETINVETNHNSVTDNDSFTDNNFVIDNNSITDNDFVTNNNFVTDNNSVIGNNSETDNNFVTDNNSVSKQNSAADMDPGTVLNSVTDINYGTNSVTGENSAAGIDSIADRNSVIYQNLLTTEKVLSTKKSSTKQDSVTGQGSGTVQDNAVTQSSVTNHTSEHPRYDTAGVNTAHLEGSNFGVTNHNLNLTSDLPIYTTDVVSESNIKNDEFNTEYPENNQTLIKNTSLSLSFDGNVTDYNTTADAISTSSEFIFTSERPSINNTETTNRDSHVEATTTASKDIPKWYNPCYRSHYPSRDRRDVARDAEVMARDDLNEPETNGHLKESFRSQLLNRIPHVIIMFLGTEELVDQLEHNYVEQRFGGDRDYTTYIKSNYPNLTQTAVSPDQLHRRRHGHGETQISKVLKEAYHDLARITAFMEETVEFEKSLLDMFGESFHSLVDILLNQKLYGVLCHLQLTLEAVDENLQHRVSENLIKEELRTNTESIDHDNLTHRDYLVLVEFKDLLQRLGPEFQHMLSLIEES